MLVDIINLKSKKAIVNKAMVPHTFFLLNKTKCLLFSIQNEMQ